MKKEYTFFNNFVAGEVSPRVLTRTDLVAHKNGAKRMRDVLPTIQGGFKGRPGTRFVARARYGNKVCHLIPFKFSVTQTYVIEAGDLYFRYFTQGGRLEEASKTITNVTNSAGLFRVTATGHGYSTGDPIAIRGVLGTPNANGDWAITVIDANTFDLQSSTFAGTYTSGGTARKIVQTTTTYTEAQVPNIRWAQDGDVLYLVHGAHPVRTLTRTSATTFSLATATITGGPFQPINTTATTMTPSATTGSITVTASASTFTANMVGMLMRIGGVVSSVQGYVEITGYTSGTVVNATVKATLDSTGASTNWALGSFGEPPGYPSEVSFIDQRLVLGGTTTEPQTVWLSEVGDPVDFTVGTTASHAVTIALFTEDLNDIRWIVSTTDLLVGTVGGEFAIAGGTDEPITATSVRARQQTNFGSDQVRPVKLGTSVVYVQRAGHRLRDAKFSFADDGYISNDLSLLAHHLFDDTTITRLAFQLQPDPTIWAVLADGALATMLVQPDQQVVAFARHATGASGSFESVCALPEATSQTDRVWVAVKRTINGSTVRYIEYFDEVLNTDCALTGTFSPAASTINGLDHLNGTTVQFLGDGAVYADKTVASGAVTLGSGETAVLAAEIGIQFTPTVTLRATEFVDQQGPMFGRVKRYTRVLVYTLDTMFLYLDGEVAPARGGSDPMDAPPPTDEEAVWQFTQLGSSTQPTLTITQPAPLPIHVTGVYGEVEVGG